jgi:hypothetical protein
LQVGLSTALAGSEFDLYICLKRSNMGPLAADRIAGWDLDRITGAAHDESSIWAIHKPVVVVEVVERRGGEDVMVEMPPLQSRHQLLALPCRCCVCWEPKHSWLFWMIAPAS